MIDYHDYVGDYVYVKFKSEGKEDEMSGTIIGYDVGLEYDKDYDSIDVAPLNRKYYIAIPIPDIKEFKVLDEE